MDTSFNNFLPKIRQEIDNYLTTTPFPIFESLVFKLAWLAENKTISFSQDKARDFTGFVFIDFIRELIGFVSDIRSGSFSTCYHHLRKIIEINASFCFVIKNLESESHWMERYLSYPRVWRFQKLLQYSHFQKKCSEFEKLKNESLTWPQLYEADTINDIQDWRGFKKGKRFSIEMLFQGAQSIFKKELKFNHSENERYEYYYDYLCNQVHFSLVKEVTLKNRIFGFSENAHLLKEVLRESSLEFMRFLAIGLHFKKIEIADLTWQDIESDYRNLQEKLSQFVVE